MAEKLLKYDVAMKSTKTVWQMDIPRANTGDENTVTFDFNITDLDSAELTGATPNVNLYMRDGSFFQCRPEEGVELNGQRVTYTMRENEGKHNGKAKAELVLIWPGTNPIQKLTSQQYAFEIANGLDTVVAVEVMIQDWTTLTAEAQVYLDQMAEKHAIADADHTRAANDHTTAVNDHTTAASDHTTALADHAVTADMIMNGTNLVKNGDFSNGTTGWGRVTSTNTVSNGVLSNTGDGGGLNPRAEQSVVGIAMNKYYIYARLRVTNSLCTTLTLNYWDTSWKTGRQIPGAVIASQWYTASAIITPLTDSFTIFPCHYYADAATANGKVMEVQYVSVIDLTAAFGKGNEPTAEQMDGIMAKFTNSWFNGTANLFRANAALNKLMAVDARTEFEAKNAVDNGDFSNGSTGWTFGGSIMSVSNGELILTQATDWNSRAISTPAIVTTGTNVFYIAASVKASTNATGINLDGYGTAVKYHSGSGAYERLSGLVTSSLASHNLYLVDKGIINTPPNVSYMKNVVVINLTAAFGAGKEPTLAEMDRLMARFPNSWFDGVKPIQTIETLYQEKANKVQEAWITPTLLNGWISQGSGNAPQYMKDDFGFVHVRGCVKNGTIKTGIFILPVGYRPRTTRSFSEESNLSPTSVKIDSAGLVYHEGNGNAYVYVDNIHFKAEQ